jgi:IclR family transcriptional regulator, KDG regulon repressor
MISSLDKSLKVIELLINNQQGLTLSQMGESLGFPASTIHHFLRTFRSYDYIAQDPKTKKYYLGPKFLSINSSILGSFDVRETAYRHLRDLHQECNETVVLWIYRHSRATIIDKITKVGGLALDTYVGYSTDPHAPASGKLLISELEEKSVRAIYKAKPLKAYGKNTITSMPHLLDELENIRKQGYAIDNEEVYEGVRCVSAPIRLHGEIIAAVSIAGSIFTIPMERIKQQLIGMVKETTQRISSELKTDYPRVE